MNNPPNSRRHLDDAIRRIHGSGAKFLEARALFANALVGQFLPDGVAKGGSALKLRYTPFDFRATSDLDVARRSSIADFERILGERLKAGWHGFTGSVAPGPPSPSSRRRSGICHAPLRGSPCLQTKTVVQS